MANATNNTNNHELHEFRTVQPIQVKVIREVYTKDCTIGKMYINGTFFAHTLEDTCRHLNGDIKKKVAGKTCIDSGTYPLTVTYSNRFKKPLPLLGNVPCFSAIRIHGGNTAADTEGCILVGANTDGVGKVWDCAGKVSELTGKLVGSMATITIV